ncbi:MAG: rhodanese-like domain-containing protein [Pseudomonadota bacterium]
MLLDIREKGEASLGQPFGAINLPYSRLEIPASAVMPRRSVSIALIDGGDGVACKAARRLAALGFHDLAIVAGGIPAWRAAGFALFEGVHVVSKAFGEWVERRFGTPSIAPEALMAAQRGPHPPLLLDVRSEAEYHRFSLPGSRSCPNGELVARFDTLKALSAADGMPVAVHCAGRTRSVIGAQTLRDLDPDLDAVAVRDGTQGWQIAGYRRNDAPTAPALAGADGEAARAAAATLIARFSLPVIDSAAAAAMATDETRTTYFIDPRGEGAEPPTPEGFRPAPATDLIQQTDRFLVVQRARVVLWDPLMARAAFAAHWLRRMGHEAVVLAGDPPRLPRPDSPALCIPPTIAPDALARFLRSGHRLLDLRPSADHATARPTGARWSFRPRVVEDAGRAPVILIGTAQVTALAAIDLLDAGVTLAGRLGGDVADWRMAEIPLEIDNAVPPLSARPDVEQFCANRHHGDLSAAAAYLAWERGLLARIAAAGLDPGWRA